MVKEYIRSSLNSKSVCTSYTNSYRITGTYYDSRLQCTPPPYEMVLVRVDQNEICADGYFVSGHTFCTFYTRPLFTVVDNLVMS